MTPQRGRTCKADDSVILETSWTHFLEHSVNKSGEMAGETEDEIPGKILCAALVIKCVNCFVIFSCDTCVSLTLLAVYD